MLFRSDATALQKQWATLVTLADVLGLEAVVEESGADGGLSDADIEAAIANRKQARADRDFAAADRIRDDLKAAGVTLIDKPDGTVFVRE